MKQNLSIKNKRPSKNLKKIYKMKHKALSHEAIFSCNLERKFGWKIYFRLLENCRHMQVVVWPAVGLFCKLEVLQEAISLVKGSLKRRCVASCKKQLPRVTAPILRRIMSSWKCKIWVKTKRDYNETVIFWLYFKVIIIQKFCLDDDFEIKLKYYSFTIRRLGEQTLFQTIECLRQVAKHTSTSRNIWYRMQAAGYCMQAAWKRINIHRCN